MDGSPRSSFSWQGSFLNSDLTGGGHLRRSKEERWVNIDCLPGKSMGRSAIGLLFALFTFQSKL